MPRIAALWKDSLRVGRIWTRVWEQGFGRASRRPSFEFYGFSAAEVKRFNQAISDIRLSAVRLRVGKYENALVSRLRPLADGNMLGGAFDAAGNPIKEAEIYRRGEGVVVGRQISDNAGEFQFIERAIYGGVLFSGFGHIILESASRLWAAKRYPDIPIVIQTPLPNDASSTTLVTLAGMLGIPAERLMFITESVKIGTAFVPEPGIVLGKEINSNYLAFIRACLGKPKTGSSGAVRRAYVSRAGLNWRQRKAVGEADLEKLLRKAGHQVVRPETRSLAEQITVQNEASTVAGFIGSQFHTLFFRTETKPIDILYLCSARPNINFFQIDLLFPGRRIYSNVALYDPAFEFGSRTPFYFDAQFVHKMLVGIGMDVAEIAGPKTGEYLYEWSIAFFYFKIFRQGLLSGRFMEVAHDRLPSITKKMTRPLSVDERLQIVKAYSECARRYRVSEKAEVVAVAEQLTTLLGLDAEIVADGGTPEPTVS